MKQLGSTIDTANLSTNSRFLSCFSGPKHSVQLLNCQNFVMVKTGSIVVQDSSTTACQAFSKAEQILQPAMSRVILQCCRADKKGTSSTSSGKVFPTSHPTSVEWTTRWVQRTVQSFTANFFPRARYSISDGQTTVLTIFRLTCSS